MVSPMAALVVEVDWEVAGQEGLVHQQGSEQALALPVPEAREVGPDPRRSLTTMPVGSTGTTSDSGWAWTVNSLRLHRPPRPVVVAVTTLRTLPARPVTFKLQPLALALVAPVTAAWALLHRHPRPWGPRPGGWP